MTAGQLVSLLNNFSADTPVVLRAIELEEVQVTVDLTDVTRYEDGSVLLIGDLEKAGL